MWYVIELQQYCWGKAALSCDAYKYILTIEIEKSKKAFGLKGAYRL